MTGEVVPPTDPSPSPSSGVAAGARGEERGLDRASFKPIGALGIILTHPETPEET